MNKRIIGVVAVATLLVGALIAPASAHHQSDRHCPGGSGHADPAPTDYTVAKHETGASANDIVLPAGTEFCVKSGTSPSGMQHTGILEADGTTTLRGYLLAAGIVDGSGNQGRDVSYYITYTPGEPQVCADVYPDADHPDLPLDGLDDPAAQCFEQDEVDPVVVCADVVDDADHPDLVLEEGDDPNAVCFEQDHDVEIPVEIPVEDPVENPVEIAVSGAMVCAIDEDDADDLGELLLTYAIDTDTDAAVTFSVDGVVLDGALLTGALPWPFDDDGILDSVELTASAGEASDTATVFADDDEIAACVTVEDVVEDVDEGDGTEENDSDSDEADSATGGDTPVVTTEVLGESLTADDQVVTVAASENLPRTGASALLLLLLGLTAVGSGGALLRRR